MVRTDLRLSQVSPAGPVLRRRLWPPRPPIQLAQGGLMAIALLAGCTFINAYEDPDLVGKWESRQPVFEAFRNTMRAKLDGSGTATLAYQLGGDPTWHTADYKIKWEQINSDEFELNMRCSGSTRLGPACGDDDFVMECKSKSDGERLLCEVTRRSVTWATIAFEWGRD